MVTNVLLLWILDMAAILWLQDQFEEHVDKYVHLEIYTYYGSQRTKDVDLLSRQDVVLTTYQTLGSDAKPKVAIVQRVYWLTDKSAFWPSCDT